MPLPHAPARDYRCRGCTLIVLIDGGPHSSTLRGERTPGTPACPQCGTRSWIDQRSFTAYYAKLESNEHICVVGPHEDSSVRFHELEPVGALETPSRAVLVITRLAAGLCAEHARHVRTSGIGSFRIVPERQST